MVRGVPVFTALCVRKSDEFGTSARRTPASRLTNCCGSRVGIRPTSRWSGSRSRSRVRSLPSDSLTARRRVLSRYTLRFMTFWRLLVTSARTVLLDLVLRSSGGCRYPTTSGLPGTTLWPASRDAQWSLPFPTALTAFFGPNAAGLGRGKLVLVWHRGCTDPALGGEFSVKKYTSTKTKVPDDGSWSHREIRLQPLNPDPAYSALVFDPQRRGRPARRRRIRLCA